jgi:hypothetical protein
LQIRVASLILPIFGVLASVRFNNKHLFERNEVNDPGADGNLSAKLDASELSRTKKLPKLAFSVRRCVTKVTRAASFEFIDSIFRHSPSPGSRSLSLALATLSHRGRG